MSLFHTPIIEAIDNFVRNPSDTKQLYDDIEAFCLKNAKAFGSDQNSILKTVAMYDAINDHIAAVKAKNFSKIVSDKIQIPRFIQAVLFKESVKTAAKLKTCNVKQFQEILFYYENRVGGDDYKSYQNEFQELFGKIYSVLTEEDKIVVEKLANSEDLTYRLKKLMKAAIQEVHASIVGRSSVAESFVKSLQSDQNKPTSAETLKTTAKPPQKTSSKKSTNKTTKSDVAGQPPVMSEEHLKEATVRVGQVSELLNVLKDPESNVVVDNVLYQPYQLSQTVQACIDFSPVLAELSKQEPTDEQQLLIKMIMQSNDQLMRNIIIDSIVTKFFDQVVVPLKDKHTAVDPLRAEFEELQEMVHGMTEGMNNMVNMMTAFSQRLMKAKK